MELSTIAVAVAALVLLAWFGLYLWGRMHHRVFAVGKDTYIRFYPNPGACVATRRRSVAISIMGGLEVFRRDPQHPESWQRTFAFASRVKRPGGLR